MSVIGKKPFVNKIIDNCSKEQVERIVSLMDNLGEAREVALYGQNNLISDADIGVNYVSLAMEQLSAKIIKGILVYINNSNCGFFGIATNSDMIEEFSIDPVNKTFEKIREYLTVEELRQVCGDALAGSGSGGDDGKEVNIIEFSNIELDPTTQTAELVTDADAWEKFFDTTEECIVVISQSNGATHTLSRSTVGGDRAIFSTQSAYGDGLADWTATFMKIGDEYTGTLAYSTVGEGGLPPSTKANQVLVSNSDAGWDETKSVPLADNLLASPETNDTLYSKGPTGGLADIATGEESYLSEVKGYTIIWNQLLDSTHTSYTCDSSHIYVVVSQAGALTLVQNSQQTWNTPYRIYDLTLMFGGNNKIPFSLSQETEYPANGTIPAQTVTGVQRFARLFANVDLVNAPYDAGTPKNVKVTKLTETGQNLWDSSMESTGLQLLAGYRYEIYKNTNMTDQNISRSYDGTNWSSQALTRYQRADGKYVWIFYPTRNCLIKSVDSTNAIVYVGFVHSGNYCLTANTVGGGNWPLPLQDSVPAYEKHEYNISGIDGLNGLVDAVGNIVVYDTKDYARVGSINLADYQSVMTWDSDEGGWVIPVSSLPNNIDISLLSLEMVYLSQKGYTADAYVPDEEIEGLLIYNGDDSVNKPTGLLYYPLSEPVATGSDPFEPIQIEVNDMGLEYFTQPTGANCPVNQVSLYYQNLKDKLVNLQMPEIEATSFNNDNTALNGLKINGSSYKLAPVGDIRDEWSVAIGQSSMASSSGTAFGRNANATFSGTAIGSIASANQGAIAIGKYCLNNVANTFAFDDASSSTILKTMQIGTPSNIFFRNYKLDNSKYNLSDYTSGHYLSEYIQNNTLTADSGKYYISYTDSNNYKTFSKSVTSGTATDISASVTGVHITVKVTGTTSHSVVGLDLLPYDATNGYGFNSYGRVDVDGTIQDILATIDSDGCVVITLATGTITEVKYNLR